MDTPNPKRPCQVPTVSSSVENPSSIPIAPNFNQSNVDLAISSFLTLSDLPLFSSPISIGCSFDRVLEKVIPSVAGTSGDDVYQDRFLDRTLQLASLLYESTKRFIKKRATLQNSITWPLPLELTAKVFSMLDTYSLMQASACCKMFNKCVMDRVCYTHIDLTMSAKNVDNGVVCILIDRAGKELRSLKLGCISPPAGYRCLLTRYCLAPLYFNNGYAGGLLRSLHLYNLKLMDKKSLSTLFESCPNLTDLKIVGFISGDNLNPLELLESFTRNCRLAEQVYLENFCIKGLAADNTLVEHVNDCPNLTSLTLMRFGINDSIARTIVMGFRQLKYINLSFSHGISGCFLRNLGHSCKDSPLETLILCNCYSLQECTSAIQNEVSLFLYSLLGGDFMLLRHIDVSSDGGLLTDTDDMNYTPKFPVVEALKKQRSGFTFVAIFPSPLPSSSSSSSSSSLGEDTYSDSSTSSGSFYYGSDEE